MRKFLPEQQAFSDEPEYASERSARLAARRSEKLL